MRPRIGITTSTSVAVADPKGGRVYEHCVISYDYLRAVIAAGGVPYPLPTLEEPEFPDMYLDEIDGLLLSGGVDMDPLLYNEEPRPGLGAVDVLRDRFEVKLIGGALERELPIFAICRGIQVLNAALGGTLYQDINEREDNQLKHYQNSPKWHGSHTVDVRPGSLLAEIVQQSVWPVNSFHHQAVHALAPGFRISATAHDGVIEAIEGVEQPFLLGVQFHPEMMWKWDPNAASLFRAFVSACDSV